MPHPTLDPELAELLAAGSGTAPLFELTPQQARERVRAGDQLCAAGPDLREVQNIEVPVEDARLPARLYLTDRGVPTATVVYLHGGGWVTGDLEYSDALCRHLAAEGGCSVLSVDYRLAPEHPFPIPVDDAYAALCWAATHLVGDERRLVVAGDSAGGALAAACALRSRDEDGPVLAGQLLVYPVLDSALDRPSYRSNGEGLVLGPREMEWFWDHYLPDARARRHHLAAPLRAADLSGLPPTALVIADLDPLRDEALAYAARLAQAEVPVHVRHVNGLTHGFLRFTGRVQAAAALVPVIAADLRRMLGD